MDRLWQRYFLAQGFTEGEAVLTITGCTVAVQRTWQWRIYADDLVTLSLKKGETDHVGVSNSGALTFTGLPSVLVPVVNDVSGLCHVYDNSVGKLGLFYLSAATPNTLTMVLGTAVGANIQLSGGAGWTAANNKGIQTQSNMIYRLRP